VLVFHLDQQFALGAYKFYQFGRHQDLWLSYIHGSPLEIITQNLFFKTADELQSVVDSLTSAVSEVVGAEMQRIAQQRYTWDKIGEQYFRILYDV
jgi:hypothetical protein